MRTKSNDLQLRSLILSQEFSRYVLEHPHFAERIPYGAEVVLLPTYDRELRDYNLRNGAVNNEPGLPIVYIEIDRLRPRRSLIVGPKMKFDKKLLNNNGRPRRKKTIAANV